MMRRMGRVGRITMTCRAVVAVLVLLSLMASVAIRADEILDRRLLDALVAKDLDGARKALEQGADPEAILGKHVQDHAMCAAIDDSTSRFLELLLEYGASVNAYYDVGHSDRRTPLACSVHLWNFAAFDYLLAHGADPSVDLFPEASAERRNSRTALTMALSGSRYPMALDLVSRYPLHPNELGDLVFHLERYPYDEAHPWNYAREALIEWTRERVPDFSPRPAHPSPTGVTRECLFMFRDHEEGRKKGSVCPRPEDLEEQP